jgi:hypothetical protein
MDRFSETSPLDFARHDIDPDEREPFFTEAEPCELCGEPCDELRWHDEFALNIGTSCSCTFPDLKMCPDFSTVLNLCDTGEEVLALFRAHLKKCRKCNGVVEMPKAAPATTKEAA